MPLSLLRRRDENSLPTQGGAEIALEALSIAEPSSDAVQISLATPCREDKQAVVYLHDEVEHVDGDGSSNERVQRIAIDGSSSTALKDLSNALNVSRAVLTDC